jgi:hypothetical protein
LRGCKVSAKPIAPKLKSRSHSLIGALWLGVEQQKLSLAHSRVDTLDTLSAKGRVAEIIEFSINMKLVIT